MDKIKLSAKERTNLRYALRSHPDVLSQVEKLSDISALDKASLLRAATALGIDVELAKAGNFGVSSDAGTAESLERWKRSNENPAFSGSIIEPMTFVLLGHSITRTLRVTYQLTPSWPYVDAETGEEVQGWEQNTMTYEFLVRREVGLISGSAGDRVRERKDREEWVNCTELFMHELLGEHFDDVIDEKIEEACLRENQVRRQRHAR